MASVLLAALSLFLRLVHLTWLEARQYAKSFYGSQTKQQDESTGPPRLSKPITQLNPSYDVVVIGSGYGGGVAASRMARATPRRSVCLLERGKERWPGEYPSNRWAALCEMRLTGHIRIPFRSIAFDFGKRTGLYQWFVGQGSKIFVGIGKTKSLVRYVNAIAKISRFRRHESFERRRLLAASSGGPASSRMAHRNTKPGISGRM